MSLGSVLNEDDFEENGLGERYLKKLAEHKDALHQVSKYFIIQIRVLQILLNR